MTAHLFQEDVMESNATGWFKLLPEMEGQAYNVKCCDQEIQKLEEEMQVRPSYFHPAAGWRLLYLLYFIAL